MKNCSNEIRIRRGSHVCTYYQKYQVDRKPSNQKTRNSFPNSIQHEAVWYHWNNREYNNCPDKSMKTNIIKEIWETWIFWTTINFDKIGYIFHGIIFIMEYSMFCSSNWNKSRNNNYNSQNQTIVKKLCFFSRLKSSGFGLWI